MEKEKNILGVQLEDHEKATEETVEELSNGKGEDDE